MTVGSTIWLTGLSGAGKSTLAMALTRYLDALSFASVVIDGDEVRAELCRDLSFSRSDRNENVRRIGCVTRLVNRHGVHAIVAAISPYRAARDSIRKQCSRFLEVHVDCPLETLLERDGKGLYQRALSGAISQFTGISDPYESPLAPEIYIDSSKQSVQEGTMAIISALASRRWVDATAPLDAAFRRRRMSTLMNTDRL